MSAASLRLEETYPSDVWDLTSIPGNIIVRDWIEKGVRILIVRRNSHLCVYLGLPEDHPLAGEDYNDVPIDCHGGLTFAGSGGNGIWPSGRYWYGYDYAHAGDYCNYGHGLPSGETGDKKWTIGEVQQEAKQSLYSLEKLMRLAEHMKCS